MITIMRSCTLLLISLSLSFIAACGTTTTIESHPALARSGESNVAKVYFLRPDIGYRGVRGNAFLITLDGKELLTLAKGEYTLVHLLPVSGVVTVESSTVISGNVMTKVKESRPFSFEAGKSYYVAFRVNQHGDYRGGGSSYIPILITDAAAIEVANGLKPIGKAMQEPIPGLITGVAAIQAENESKPVGKATQEPTPRGCTVMFGIFGREAGAPESCWHRLWEIPALVIYLPIAIVALIIGGLSE